MMNGSCITELVYITLKEDDNVFITIANFCKENVDAEVITAVVTYIIRAYYRMRCKDFARKLMSTNIQQLKQSRRPTLACVSNLATHKAKRKKEAGQKKEEDLDGEASNNENEYLLFDAATGNSSTEEKDTVDDNNLLES